MRNRSYISTSKLALATIFFALTTGPLIIFSIFIAPKFNGLVENADLARFAMNHMDGRPVILLGESTIRSLNANRDLILSEKTFVNLALPGGNGGDSRELLRIALNQQNQAKIILYGTVMSGSANARSTPRGYLPALLQHKEIWTSWREKRITLLSAIELSYRRLFSILNAKADVYFRLIQPLSPTAANLINSLDLSLPFEKDLVQSQGDQSPIETIANLAAKHNLKFVFFLGPFHSENRKSFFFAENKRFFQELCRLPIECWDLSESLPDEGFASDGFHMQKDQLARFRSLLFEKLKIPEN